MRNLERCAGEVERRGVPGAYVEAGVALGGSAILLASLMGQGRRFHGYDVFEQIPPPSERDGADAHERYRVIEEGKSKGIGGDAYYGYLDDLYGRVVRSFTDRGLVVDGETISLPRLLRGHSRSRRAGRPRSHRLRLA